MWETGVALAGMCVREGKEGVQTGLGELGRFFFLHTSESMQARTLLAGGGRGGESGEEGMGERRRKKTKKNTYIYIRRADS